MKPFTSNCFYLFTMLICLAACGKEQTPVTEVQTTQEEIVTVPEEAPVIQKVTANAEESASLSSPNVKSTKNTSFYPEEVVIALKNWDKKLLFLTTNFKQTSYYDGVQISHSQGTLKYDKKRDLLRLDTLDNTGALEQSALTNKQEIMIFDESGRQVTNLSWKEWQQGQPNQALFDFGNYTALLDRHNVSLQKGENNMPVLVLTPKDKEGEEYTLYLTLSREDYFPTSIKIVSDLMITQSDLSKTDKTTPIDIAIFGGLFQ